MVTSIRATLGAFTIMSLLVGAITFRPYSAGAQDAPAGVPASAAPATVTGHVDGDTFTANLSGSEEIILLAAVDAPNGGECYGVESATRLRSLIPVNASVYLESSGEDRDDDGKLIRYVWVSRPGGGNAILLNSRLVREGYAGFDTKSDAPTYSGRIEKLENGARDDGEGLWGTCGEIHAPAELGSSQEPTQEEEEASSVGFTEEEQSYALTTAGYLGIMGDSLGRFGDLMQNPDIGDADWTYDVATELATWKVVYEEVSALSPPPVFSEMHSVLLAGLEKYSLAADQIAYGLDNYDTDALNYALSLLEEGLSSIQEASNIFDAIVEERT